MRKQTSIYAVIICMVIVFAGLTVVLKAQTFKKKDAVVLYKVNSYDVITNNDASLPLVINQVENNQFENISIDDDLTRIKDYIKSINRIPDLIVKDNIDIQKLQVLTDDIELQKIVDDPNTSLRNKQYYNSDNKLLKIVFEMSHPIMRLTEEYYIFDDSKIYYKSDSYLGVLISDVNSLQIELFYPEYKKNIRKPIFLNEITDQIINQEK